MTQPNQEMVNKFHINQKKKNSSSYHFGTSGTIFGLGYGPKCHCNEHGYSIDRYSNSEYNAFFFVVLYIFLF